MLFLQKWSYHGSIVGYIQGSSPTLKYLWLYLRHITDLDNRLFQWLRTTIIKNSSLPLLSEPTDAYWPFETTDVARLTHGMR